MHGNAKWILPLVVAVAACEGAPGGSVDPSNACELVDCQPEHTCEVQQGQPVCVPTAPNPCAYTTCLTGSTCIVQDGQAVCVSRNPCLGFACPDGQHCEAPADAPSCVPDDPRACGDVTCGEGQVCCNASCGICTPPDGACIQIACE